MSSAFLRRRIFALAGILLGATSSAWSQPAATPAWPDRPIQLLIPYPPGGSADLLGRPLAMKLQERLGQNVVLEYKPGAGGTVASQALARAKPDGHTLILVLAAHAINASLYPKLPYDTRKDFAPVSLVANLPMIVAASSSLKANTIPELIAAAKAAPGKLTFGSAGNGNITHLGAYLLLHSRGLQATHVPYKGSAPALTDLVGGQTQFMTDTINSALPFIRDNRLRALAVTSLKRTSVLPEAPTLNETVMPKFEVGAWQGMLVPAKTPADIVKRLNAEVMKALNSPDVKAKLAVQGAEPLGSTPEEYGQYIQSEIARWGQVVKLTGASLE